MDTAASVAAAKAAAEAALKARKTGWGQSVHQGVATAGALAATQLLTASVAARAAVARDALERARRAAGGAVPPPAAAAALAKPALILATNPPAAGGPAGPLFDEVRPVVYRTLKVNIAHAEAEAAAKRKGKKGAGKSGAGAGGAGAGAGGAGFESAGPGKTWGGSGAGSGAAGPAGAADLAAGAPSPWFDPSLRGTNRTHRRRAALRFVNPGYYEERAQRLLGLATARQAGLAPPDPETLERLRREEEASTERFHALLKYQRRGGGAVGAGAGSAGGAAGAGNDGGPDAAGGAGGAFGAAGAGSEFEGGDGGAGSVFAAPPPASHIGTSIAAMQERQAGLLPEFERWDLPLVARAAGGAGAAEAAVAGAPGAAGAAATAAAAGAPAGAAGFSALYNISYDKITNLIEHPVLMRPVLDLAEAPPRALALTPAERAKLRRQRRQEKEQEKRDMVRMGLLAPAPPKVRLANLHRVLGQQSAADPSKTEQQVRMQVTERVQGHLERNAARKLTAAARRQKAIKKFTKVPADLLEFPEEGALACVFFVADLTYKLHLFKVDKNAQQLRLTGVVLLTPGDGNVVVVEGTPKALKAYKNLMLRRIKWGDRTDVSAGPASFKILAPPRSVDETQPLPGEGGDVCRLLWEGVVARRGFREWKTLVVRTGAEAANFFAELGLEHYWELTAACREHLRTVLPDALPEGG